jgi:diguanylate cyclase (GGDEF)-like protein
LTNLANRYLLLEELRRMLQGLARRGGSVALVFIDLDHFKRINDEYGHDVGDEALTAVARRLVGAVRGDDVVSRLGGDEFVIAHVSTDRQPDGDHMVSRVRKVLSAPFRLRGQAFDVGASIGWVSTDSSDVGPDELLSRADQAMYRHKRDRPLVRGGVA